MTHQEAGDGATKRRPDNFLIFRSASVGGDHCRRRFTVGIRLRLTGADFDATPDALCAYYTPRNRESQPIVQ